MSSTAGYLTCCANNNRNLLEMTIDKNQHLAVLGKPDH